MNRTINNPHLLPYTVSPMDIWDKGSHYIVSFETGLQLKVTERLLNIFSCMNGTLSYEEIKEQLKQKYDLHIEIEELCYFVENLLLPHGVIVGYAKKSEHNSAILFRTPLMTGERFEKIAKPFHWLFQTPWSILTLFGIGFCFLLNFYQVQTTDMAGLFGTFSGVGISLILLLLSILFHEFGHVVAAYRYSIRPRDIGIGLYMLVPVMFVDLSEAWKLPRRQRVVIDFSGIYFQLLMVSGLTIWYSLTAEREILIATQLILYSVVLNLNPILRYDGFWALNDAIGIYNVHTRAFTLLKTGIKGYLLCHQESKDAFHKGIRMMEKKIRSVLLLYFSLYILMAAAVISYILYTVIHTLLAVRPLTFENTKGLWMIALVILLQLVLNMSYRLIQKKKQIKQMMKEG
ncbi:hypothetical protein B9C88_00415 [Brevibacillus laterosporus]|uniref:site-2 protease family protein n=1 Tax=Brevibacillus laterosporus TaxID=1465 RepID=UPI000BC5952B|nr:site-2 protease family protein [Brevibacillus laterosporus]PCN46030.1 hypothetical protein B9C88_00415 [Brevibacillus laterosporus]